MDFNSRPSARGDRRGMGNPGRALHFNSRPSARGDADFCGRRAALRYFNSRPSARGDCDPCYITITRTDISIHAPPRGATIGLNDKDEKRQFQFTPLREGRRTRRRYARRYPYFNSRPSARGDYARAIIRRMVRISIHAPPRGATRRRDVALFKLFSISIHAPPRGATCAQHKGVL